MAFKSKQLTSLYVGNFYYTVSFFYLSFDFVAIIIFPISATFSYISEKPTFLAFQYLF